jgi:hypothetical protein
MMDDDVIDQMEPGYIELARRLEAYADLRLSPSAAATTRMRTAVMAAAHRRAALIGADATFDAAGSTGTAAAVATVPGPAVATRTSWRRPLAAVFAGTLTLAILAGSVYGARAGGPLYAARLWAEMRNLPANVVDRAQAEASRLEERLDEAQQASSAGDVPATEAALSAYSTIVVEAANGSEGDPTATATIEVTVTRHVVILTLMVDSVPAQARASAVQALSSSTMALDDLDGAAPPSSDGPGASDEPHPVGGIDGVKTGAGQPGASDPAARQPVDKDPVAGTKRHADPGSPGKLTNSGGGPKPSKPPKGDDGTVQVGPGRSAPPDHP